MTNPTYPAETCQERAVRESKDTGTAAARKAAAEQRAAERTAKLEAGQRAWCEANGYGAVTFAERDAAKAAEVAAEKATREHVGTVKTREIFELTLDRVGSFERPSYSGYGSEVVWFYNFRDARGNLLVWKTTTGAMIDAGSTVRVKATVKEHGEYNGEAQTMITRVALVEVVAEVAA